MSMSGHQFSCSHEFRRVIFKNFRNFSIIYVSLLLIGIFVCVTGCTSPANPMIPMNNSSSGLVTIVDLTNNSITLYHPADRIVTTSTYATEYLIAIGAGDKIIGDKVEVIQDPLFQSHLANAQVVGAGGNPDFEKIIALNPDIIFMPVETTASAKEQFRKANLTVVYFDYYSLDAMPGMVRAMGKITGRSSQAQAYLDFYRKYDDLLTNRLQNVSTNQETPVYYEMSTDYSTAGVGSGGYNYLKKLRVKNVAGDLPGSYPVVSAEWILSENPEVITKNSGTSQNMSDTYNALVERPGFSAISAVKNKRVYVVNSDTLYGPRNIIGLISLAKIYYPDRFYDIDPDSVLDEYAGTFFEGANNMELVYPNFSA